MKLLNRAQLKVEKGIDYSPSQLNRKMRDGTFPLAIRGVGKENHWLENEVDQYLTDLAASRAPRRPLPAAGMSRRA